MRLTAALAACVLSTVMLAACGGGASTSSKAAGRTATASVARAPSSSRASTARTGPSTAARPSTGPAAHSTTAAHPLRASSTASSAQFKQALASFPACLSRNGVKLPSASGSQGTPASSPTGVDRKSPAYHRALAACTSVLDAALKAATKARPRSTSPPATRSTGASPGAPSSAQAPSVKPPASVTAGFERFTACMRSNGVPGFPEPKGASFNLSGTHLNPHSPQYKTAEARCDPILQAVDDGG